MATISALESLVVSDYTRRPEISAVTKAAVRTAILRAHHVDFFPRDLATQLLTYTPSSSAIFYDFANFSSTAESFRAMKSLVCVDSATQSPVEELEYRVVDDLYDSDGIRRAHIYTLIGDTLRIFPSQVTGAVTAYYYRNPKIAGDVVTSWIADTYADEIAAWAAAIVFARTGFTEQAQNINTSNVQPFKESLISSHLLAHA